MRIACKLVLMLMIASACSTTLPEQSDALDLAPKRNGPVSRISPDVPQRPSAIEAVSGGETVSSRIEGSTATDSAMQQDGVLLADPEIKPANTVAAVNAYKLGAGDQIRVTVFGEEDLSGEFQIDSSGTFSLPLIGEINALNSTTRQLETQISDKLRHGFLRDPRTSIEVLNYRPFFILGEVNQPGSYPYQAGLTVLNAAALAGGFTYRADENDMSISRNGDPARTVKAEGNTIVLPGDVVRIDERFF